MPIKNIKDLEKRLGLEEGVLAKGFTEDEEVEISLPEVIRTKEEDDTFKATLTENIKSQAKSDFSNLNLEMAIKQAKIDRGMEAFEGKKDLNIFLDAFQNKVLEDAKIEPDKKIQEQNESLGKLRITIQEQKDLFENHEKTFSQFKQQTTIDNMLMRAIPESGLNISRDRALILFKSEFNTSLEDGNLTFSKNGGGILKDKMESPLKIDVIMGDFVNDFRKKAEGGAGGGNENPKKGTDVEEVVAKLEEEGKTDEQINQELLKRTLKKEFKD
ncbi:hypothetical protein LCGC14_0370770 [marine sediment metagenome]|uniref:Uncharacterized protein n=1 Tax=marine sediment metagenome TaxID=412755 RepID=A0A0F9VSF7_9ZZZZ|nr:hypothetical protein [Maribacter sp.]HDZ04840.1 hypothetical protein [Maribacter sp.]